MSKVAKWMMALISVAVLCAAGGALLVYLRRGERACADYTYQDALEYVERGLAKSASESPSTPDDFLANATICSAQKEGRAQQSGDPFVVNICSGQSGNVVGFAEVYADCGLEWRRR